MNNIINTMELAPSNGQKSFYGNENGCPIEEIATIIGLCSDEEYCRRDILSELKKELEE